MPRKKKILSAVKRPGKTIKPVKEVKEGKGKAKTPETPRGMRDILPSEQKFWQYLRRKAEDLALDFNYERIDTPIVEETGLFVRAVGKQTDIVEKEMFSFVDQGGENVSLRPELTAPITRAYINHGMANLPQPVKLYYLGQIFRHERPQAGRYRQFNQFGFEVLGDKNPIIDVEIILLCHNFFAELGLKTEIQINSIGCPNCRPNYKNVLIDFYKTRRSSLCETCKKRLVKNPLRLLDCKERDCAELALEAPQIIDWLCEECKSHFVKVLEYLDELGIPYVLNPRLVRGLDYYTKTVFEVWPAFAEATAGRPVSVSPGGIAAVETVAGGAESSGGEPVTGEKVQAEAKKEIGSQSALGAGGRYDGLADLLGGRPTPACGAALGLERVILQLKEQGVAVPELKKPEIFLAQLGEPAKRKLMILFQDLRKKGFSLAASFSRDGLKPQLETANRLGVKLTLILGQKEIGDGTIIIRDMEGGFQEIVDFKKIDKELNKRLRNGIVVEEEKNTGTQEHKNTRT